MYVDELSLVLVEVNPQSFPTLLASTDFIVRDTSSLGCPTDITASELFAEADEEGVDSFELISLSEAFLNSLTIVSTSVWEKITL